MKKLFLFLSLIFSAIISNGQTIAHTIDTVRITNDTAITTQTRVHGVTHQIEGYIIDTTLGLVARLATSINALAAPTLQKVLNAGDSANAALGNAVISLRDIFGDQALLGPANFQINVAGYGPVAALGIFGSTVGSLQLTDPLSTGFSVLVSGNVGASVLRVIALPSFRNGQIALSGDGSTPTQVAGTGAGTSPVVSFGAGSDDVSGVIQVATGTSPSGSNAVITTLTFNTAYPGKAIATLTPANANAAALSGATQVYSTCSNPAVTLTLFSGSSALTASTTYMWNYTVAK